MTGTVLPLNNSSVGNIPARDIDPLLVEKLERLLDQAKSGELRGFAIAMLYPGDLTTWDFAGRTTRGLLGTVMLLQGDLVKTTLDRT
jgi:hypothetical protein